jgi:enterochelin esterase-like enzyme
MSAILNRRRFSAALAGAPLVALATGCASRRQDIVELPQRTSTLVDLGMITPGGNLLPRNVTVWLPPDYERSGERRHRVVYMHDGQQLFDAASASGVAPWRVDEALAALIALGDVPPSIIVAIGNTAQRWYEYAPDAALRALPAPVRAAADAAVALPGASLVGDAYVRFIADELKPQIDQRFRTLSTRDDTLLMGSDMGAVAALYALCRRPDVFGGVACLSTHWPVTRIAGIHDNPGAPPMIALAAGVLAWFDMNLPRAGTHRLYFDHGSQGLDRLYAPYQARMDAVGAAKGYRLGVDWLSRAVSGAGHTTAAWQARLPGALRFLLRTQS